MSKQMTLHELIDQVKEELLTPTRADSADELYPFLFVDEVELEVNVAVSDKLSDSGKLTLYVLEAGIGGEKSQEKGHKVTIKLSPLVTKEEMRARLKLDGRLWKGIEEATTQATVKDIPLAEG
jgi:hypothetical protein